MLPHSLSLNSYGREIVLLAANSIINKKKVMKKILMATVILAGLMSCGSQSTESESTSDTATMTDANMAPMGDTANQINSNTGNFTADTSNRNGDDSVSGSNPASRSTTPGNDSGQSRQ